ncbi:MAG: hypothetical protein EOO41_00985 [Methanobacteriota archaeon]|nr:MAG: hypothetical protein EOO41_00985 [Euryarchaeota archaeon]
MCCCVRASCLLAHAHAHAHSWGAHAEHAMQLEAEETRLQDDVAVMKHQAVELKNRVDVSARELRMVETMVREKSVRRQRMVEGTSVLYAL